MREEENEETGDKFTLLDLDDEQGADVCKAYLCSLERLACSLALELSSRTYRQQFTNSYKVLYQQMRDQFGSKAAYLPEILDSAQESFDHLWVNGEKYVFSDHVVESGTLLSTHFTALRDYITNFYQKYYDIDGNSGSLDQALAKDLSQLKQMLVKFDDLWTQYESKYVGELMVIEGDARRFIVESISLERELGQKRMQLPEMQTKVQETRASLLDNICKVNAVANVEGKGRDDFKLSLLEHAEKLLQGADGDQSDSKAVTHLANHVKSTFAAYGDLMREYEANIELVDPQLKNNELLVKVVSEFENAWGIAANQISDPERLEQLNLFSKLLLQTQQQIPQFNEQVECRDASIFMTIPALLIMETLLKEGGSEEQVVWNGLCQRFKDDITTLSEWTETESKFKLLKQAKTLVEALRMQVLDL